MTEAGRDRLRTASAALVMGGALIWSAAAILLRGDHAVSSDTTTIRIGHRGLETGIRDAVAALAAEYQRMHPGVRILQDAIPETMYGPWVTTQLLGGTAPDIIQIGLGVPDHIWVAYQAKYFVPLSSLVGRPNPYNEGTHLAGVPLRQTFKDGMRSGYVPEIQEYVRIGLSQIGMRIFYNRTLLRALTGIEEPPRDYRGFMEACGAIGRHRQRDGTPYVPIAASSAYHAWVWEYMMADILTYPAIERMDFNRDGRVDQFEHFVAFRTGRMDFAHPAYRARFRMFSEIAGRFNPGWTGLGRDEAVFLFAQQRAVFISAGSWDARSLEAQAENRFEVGVMDFPLPTQDDPDYGEFIRGPRYETPWPGLEFGITRMSRNPGRATDFLLFLASRRVNEQFNRIIGWGPAVVGADMDPLLKAFEPHLEGVYGVMNFVVGGRTWVRWQQEYALYQIGQIGYEELAARFGLHYAVEGLKDYEESQREWRRAILVDEGLLGGLRGQALMAATSATGPEWIRYRTLTSTRLVLAEIAHARLDRMILAGPEQGARGPYERSTTAPRRIRARAGT